MLRPLYIVEYGDLQVPFVSLLYYFMPLLYFVVFLPVYQLKKTGSL